MAKSYSQRMACRTARVLPRSAGMSAARRTAFSASRRLVCVRLLLERVCEIELNVIAHVELNDRDLLRAAKPDIDNSPPAQGYVCPSLAVSTHSC
jgi:hypothetical protein